MDFEIEKFIDRLKEKAATKQEAARLIYEEIRAAENQKVAFLDQAKENPDFTSMSAARVTVIWPT